MTRLRIVRMCGGRSPVRQRKWNGGNPIYVRRWDVLIPRRVPGWGLVWDVIGRALVWGPE